MHLKVLSQWLADRLVVGHSTRAAALLRVVGALLTGGKLSLTHLGRSLNGPAHVKHQIKAVDRLLGNRHLHRERDGIYRAIVQTLLLGNKRPVIVVDWADFELGRQWLMLKAAVPVGGRAISLYERVFPFKRYNSPGAHREFLRALHAVLPADCRPIIVTDAGFRGPWFRDVESFGWDWVGRIRNKIKYFNDETGRWRITDSLYPEASTVPRYVGEVTLSRRHQYRFRLHLVRAHRPRVGRPPRRGPNLNALADGFYFPTSVQRGRVLVIRNPETLASSHPSWFDGFLEIASDHSLLHLACGSKFFVLLVLARESILPGRTYGTCSIPTAYWNPNARKHGFLE